MVEDPAEEAEAGAQQQLQVHCGGRALVNEAISAILLAILSLFSMPCVHHYSHVSSRASAASSATRAGRVQREPQAGINSGCGGKGAAGTPWRPPQQCALSAITMNNRVESTSHEAVRACVGRLSDGRLSISLQSHQPRRSRTSHGWLSQQASFQAICSTSFWS